VCWTLGRITSVGGSAVQFGTTLVELTLVVTISAALCNLCQRGSIIKSNGVFRETLSPIVGLITVHVSADAICSLFTALEFLNVGVAIL
jgi:hypothetical protein